MCLPFSFNIYNLSKHHYNKSHESSTTLITLLGLREENLNQKKCFLSIMYVLVPAGRGLRVNWLSPKSTHTHTHTYSYSWTTVITHTNMDTNRATRFYCVMAVKWVKCWWDTRGRRWAAAGHLRSTTEREGEEGGRRGWTEPMGSRGSGSTTSPITQGHQTPMSVRIITNTAFQLEHFISD